MGSNYSGIKKVEYDVAGNAFAAAINLGAPLSDSGGPSEEPQVVETGKGTNLYAGVKGNPVFNFSDLTKFAGLETIMKADTEIDVRITDIEDNVTTVATNASVQVKKITPTGVGNKNTYEMNAQSFSV